MITLTVMRMCMLWLIASSKVTNLNAVMHACSFFTTDQLCLHRNRGKGEEKITIGEVRIGRKREGWGRAIYKTHLLVSVFVPPLPPVPTSASQSVYTEVCNNL